MYKCIHIYIYIYVYIRIVIYKYIYGDINASVFVCFRVFVKCGRCAHAWLSSDYQGYVGRGVREKPDGRLHSWTH